MNRLLGKTAIVTGGAVGIGRACVIRMAEEGAKIAILDMLEQEGKALTADLTAAGHDVAFWPVDVASEAAMKVAIDAAAARFGGLHVLVNNAGISGSPKPTDQVAALEQEKAALTAFLVEQPEPAALRLHPRLSDLYREKISALAEALNLPELKPQATELLRGLISEVRMVPDRAAPGFHHIELIGDLAGILALGGPDMTKPPRLARAGVSDRSVTMVAGTDFHKYLPLSQADWVDQETLAA